jgi:hypothetical protein
MYGFDLPEGCIVKQLIRDAFLTVIAAGLLLLYSDVLFNVTSCDSRLVIGD